MRDYDVNHWLAKKPWNKTMNRCQKIDPLVQPYGGHSLVLESVIWVCWWVLEDEPQMHFIVKKTFLECVPDHRRGAALGVSWGHQ